MGGALILWGYDAVNTFSPSDQPQFSPDKINMFSFTKFSINSSRKSMHVSQEKIYVDSYNRPSSVITLTKYDILGFHSLAV